MVTREPNVTAPTLLPDTVKHAPSNDVEDLRLVHPDGINQPLLQKLILEIRRFYRIRLFLKIQAYEKSLISLIAKYSDLSASDFIGRYIQEGDRMFREFSFSKSDVADFRSYVNALGMSLEKFEKIDDIDLEVEESAVGEIEGALDSDIDMADPMDILQGVSSVVCHRLSDLLEMPIAFERPPIDRKTYDAYDRVGKHGHGYCDGGIIMLTSRSGAEELWDAVRFSKSNDHFPEIEELDPIGGFHVISLPGFSYRLSSRAFHGFSELPLASQNVLMGLSDEVQPDLSFSGKILAIFGYNSSGRIVRLWTGV
ncbi:MAG: hypothetical protein Q8P68_05905 [Candidatus Peregrinibacteria bacterium]|nr:hypothetical protein [Candidatus Peregrinibacteria bacterium]MDZ4244957.1 hypothetical protein [Candidatus Gracilibacteria bacterium]